MGRRGTYMRIKYAQNNRDRHGNEGRHYRRYSGRKTSLPDPTSPGFASAHLTARTSGEDREGSIRDGSILGTPTVTHYKIDTNVPPPSEGWKYPFSEMAIGHSFWVPAPEAMRATNAATVRGKRKGEVYVSRKEGDGHRIWRVA